MNILNSIKAALFPSVASITADFHKAVTKLEKHINKLDVKMEKHHDEITKRRSKINELDYEATQAEGILMNLKTILNIHNDGYEVNEG